MIRKRHSLGFLAAVGLAASAAQADGPVIHAVLEGVKSNGNGTYTAVFGYQNDGNTAVSVPSGEDNKFTPALGAVPVTVFEPGRVHAAFEVPFNGENLVWTLESPDGSRRTSTASRDSQPFELPARSEGKSSAPAPLESPMPEATMPEAMIPAPQPLTERFLAPMPVENLPVVPPTPTPEPTATLAPTPEPEQTPTPTPEPLDVPDEFTLPKPELTPQATPTSEPTPASPPPDFEPEPTPTPEATLEFMPEMDDEPSS